MAVIPVKRKSSKAIWAWLLPVAGALALLLFFCGRRNDTSETRTTGADLAAGGSVPAIAHAAACSADTQCNERQLCLSGGCADISASTSECQNGAIHFATGSTTVSSESLSTLDRMTRCLKADHKMKLAIEGSADERGTHATNATLSEQRARAVAHQLETRGVSGEQLHVVSYGENAPLCGESDEGCWAKNRRASMNTRP